MFIIEIIGGLGNQMFGYAFTLAMKHHYGAENVCIYTGRFNEVQDNQGYELKRVFGIEEVEIVEKRVVANLIDNSRSYVARLRRRLFGQKTSYFREHCPKFDPLVYSLNGKKKMYVEGLWQDEDFFKDIRNTVLDKFRFETENISPENAKVLKEINSANAVSLHVRRGDYVSNPNYMGFLGGVCNMLYYQKALAQLELTEDGLSIFVFSDDIEWVQSNFSFLRDKNVKYINHNKGVDSYMDMYLMSQCKHNIIANSTFSWWGAWLNRNPAKKIFAPKIWFLNSPGYDGNHIVPDQWIKIDNTTE